MAKNNSKQWYNLERATGENGVTIFRIFGAVAGGWFADDDYFTGAAEFVRELDTVPGDLELHVNSPGGEVFEGFAIYNALAAFRARGHKVTGCVDGSAMSIASVLLMACDRVVMPANSFQMIHFPWATITGNSEELISAAEELEKLGSQIADIYATRGGTPREKIVELMRGAPGADGSFLTAEECAGLGLCDEVIPNVAAAACVGAEHWRGVPAALVRADEDKSGSSAEASDFADWCEVVNRLKKGI